MKPRAFPSQLILVWLILIITLTSCSGSADSPPTGTATPVPPTRTPFPPSPTPIPTAAVVNGELITLAAYQEELARYQAAFNRDLTEEDRQIVLQDMIYQTLLAQGAAAEGFQVSEEELDQRLSNLETGSLSLQDWLADNGYTEESFRANLKRSLEAAWMRDQILAEVPTKAEQIRAQQILFYERNLAESVDDTIRSGANFDQLAAQYDPQTRGDLGWFPRGYLTLPALDEILFALEGGDITEIIETEIGYHIIKIIEKDQDRPLDPAVRLVLQEQALQDWLDRRWKLSTIEITQTQ